MTKTEYASLPKGETVWAHQIDEVGDEYYITSDFTRTKYNLFVTNKTRKKYEKIASGKNPLGFNAIIAERIKKKGKKK